MYDRNSTTEIITDFEGLIIHYGKKCGGEEMTADLWAFLWDMVAHGKAISRRYVAVALRNEFIRYAKILQRREKALQPPEWWENSPKWEDFDSRIYAEQLLDKLTHKQRRVFELCEFYGFSVAEIARRDGCSRQAINRLRKDGIDKLKSLL